ncbi:MAG: Fic family protein, partial [Peptoniphilus harei]|nr:Fic family protein [Peptoniphilus harei]
MEYLYKIYYKDKNFYEETYKNRINFEESLRTGLFIKSLKEQGENQLYFVYNMKTSKLIDRVMQNDYKLEKLNESLPGLAERAFILDLISSELKSTNDLEGIESDKDEIIETTKNIIND